MALETPICVSVISQSANDKVNLAGYAMMLGLTILMESPVIDLLSTATTFGQNRHNYRLLSKFTWIMMAVVTVVHSAVAFTPLFWVVTEGILNTEHAVAAAARPAMQIMCVWSAFIGWRRYLHGLMIRAGVTKPISVGTLVRVMTVAVVAFGCFKFTQLDGLVITGLALLVSVIAETMFIHYVSRQIVHERFVADEVGTGVKTTLAGLFKFHAPLTASSFIMIASLPLIVWAINESPQPVLYLAAWQVATTLMWLFRSVTFALPEAVIALYSNASRMRSLIRFCATVGAVLSGLLLLLSLTKADAWIFRNVLGAPEELVEPARVAMILAVLLPVGTAITASVRGFLTAHHITSARLWAIGVGTVCLVTSLLLGINLGWPGVATGSVAWTAGIIGEGAVLIIWWRRTPQRAAILAGGSVSD